MPHHGQRLGILFGQQPQRNFPSAGSRVIETDDSLPSTSAASAALARPGADLGGHVAGSNRRVVLLYASIREMHFEHDLSRSVVKPGEQRLYK
jgi:hypothetical protein